MTAVSDDKAAIAYAADREVRFAVVLYGGVSLAIYMNGIVQELYSLVARVRPRPAEPPCTCATSGRGARVPRPGTPARCAEA